MSQLHLGGGSPTFLNDAELGQLMAMLRRHFVLAPGGEYSIEVDPRTVDPAAAGRLWLNLGFNRLSFGVQDFDLEVQKAVHRVQPAQQVFTLVEAARTLRLRVGQCGPDLRPAPADARNRLSARWPRSNELRPDRIALVCLCALAGALQTPAPHCHRCRSCPRAASPR